MASIKRMTSKKDSEGRHKYHARYRLPGVNNPRSLTMMAKDASEVQRRIDLITGHVADSEGLTWEEALRAWDNKIGREMNESYVKDYHLVINQFTKKEYQVKGVCGASAVTHRGWGNAFGLTIQSTTVQHISDFMDWRRDQREADLKRLGKPVDPTSGNAAANKARMILLAMARSLRREGTLPPKPFPFEIVSKRKHRYKRSRAFEPTMIPQYLAALPEEARLPVEWMLFTGWRSTPTCTLQEKDIDEVRLIAFQIHKGKKERDEPLDVKLLDIIRRARDLKKSKNANRATLFVNTEGDQWTRDALLQRCQDRWKKAGLPRRKIHELRTTFGTTAGKLFSTSKVQAALGHDSPQSTAHYIDQKAMDIAEVGSAVRDKINQVLEASSTSDQATQSVGTGKNSKVMVICPELRIKGEVDRQGLLRLLKKEGRNMAVDGEVQQRGSIGT